jgi:hypothetical protein
VLPRSRRAALAGLTLYEAVTPRQRMASSAAAALLRAGLHRVLPESVRTDLPWAWWERWISEVGEPYVGQVGHVAFRAPPSGDRTCVLLMDPAGRPVGFAKTLAARLAPMSAAVRGRLADPTPQRFRVPSTIAEDEFDGVHYILFEPLPAGRHRRPPAVPEKVHAIVDEIRQRLETMRRPTDVPSHYAVCHRGFTPRNIRVTSDGRWWVFDWDTVSWAPRLTYELRYWSAEYAYRLRPRVDRDAERVLALLHERGTVDDIVEAVEWPGHRPTHRAIEREIHRAVGDLARRS